MVTFLRRPGVVLSLLAMAGPVSSQSRQIVPVGEHSRVALVIGNDQYQSLQRLSNSANDARDMAAALRDLGFSVIEQENANRETLETAVDRFIRGIHPGDVALFYYSGHGMQINGENYLAPVDLAVQNEVQARTRSLKAGEVLEQMEAAGSALNILVLDACRDNPFGGSRSIGGHGLAQMNAGKGTLIAYATAPGRVADDNRQGNNGLYTFYLLQALRMPGLALEQVFKTAGAKVQDASEGRQIPWISSSYDGDFYFRGGAPAAPATSVTRTPADADAWDAIRGTNSADLFEQFLKEYPASQYAGAARLKLAALRAAATPKEPAPSAMETEAGGGKGAATPPTGAIIGAIAGGGAPNVRLVIAKFAEKETEFGAALSRYGWRQVSKLQELDANGAPQGGQWNVLEDMVAGPGGTWQSVALQPPVNTLKSMLLTPQDEADLRNLQLFFLTTADLPFYNIRYTGRENIDQIGTYRFEVAPKKISGTKRYFEGTIWVDDRDLFIVKSSGRAVGNTQKGNVFPRFDVYREQIDGKYWFPTYAVADETLRFPGKRAQRIKMTIRYTDYKLAQ